MHAFQNAFIFLNLCLKQFFKGFDPLLFTGTCLLPTNMYDKQIYLYSKDKYQNFNHYIKL